MFFNLRNLKYRLTLNKNFSGILGFRLPFKTISTKQIYCISQSKSKIFTLFQVDMAPNVSVPMNFGLKLLDSPTHNTLELKASQGAVVRASSVILSFNSPVIDHMTTSLHLTSVDMEEFSEEAVRYFVDAAYSGQSPPISRNLFRDIHKLANVFQMSWLVTRCVQQFTDIAQSLQEPSYEDLLFLFDEAVYVLSQLKSRELVETALSKIRTLNEEQNFIRNYLVDLNSLSTQQLDLIIELAGTSVEYIVEPLTEQLRTSLDNGKAMIPANCKYILENCELHHCQMFHGQRYGKLFDVLQEISDKTIEDSKWVHQIYRKSTEAVLTLAGFSKASNLTESCKSAATSVLTPNSIPNLFHTIDFKMSFDEVVDWLGTSTEVTNLIMFFEGIWTWMLTNGYVHFSSSKVLSRLIEIKDKRGWADIFIRWMTMWGFLNGDLMSIMKNDRRLCTNKYDETKWISVSTSLTVNDIDMRSIFEKEIKLDFTIKGHAAIDKRNCHIQGRCGLILKTVPAKDGANVVLCTDPAEYPDDMHFHEEFQAKDMHLTAVLAKPHHVFFPLSWLGTPVIRDGSVEWGEILSKLGDSKCLNFHLFVCLD